MILKILLLPFLLATSIALSCSPGLAAPLKVVTTTGMIADTTRAIGKHLVDVTALMGEGVDPHLYKAAPGDMRLLSQADVVFYNGLHLEGRLGDVLEKLAKRKPVVAITSTLDRSLLWSPPEYEGNYDPHVWFDTALWSEVATFIAEILTKHLPSHATAIEHNVKEYLDKVRQTDSWMRSELSQIPPSRRILITAHDAFGYFGRAYGIEVMGIQGLSTDSEASIRDVSQLVSTIVEKKVPAVFVESSVPPKTIHALIEGVEGRGHSVILGGELLGDALGKAGTPEGTYLGMLRHNVSVIVKALGEPAAKAAP